MTGKIKMIRIGKTEENILNILKKCPKRNIDLCLKIYKEANEVTRNLISQSCKSLIEKGLIKKVKTNFYFIKDIEVISKIAGNKQKIANVPKMERTKNWKKGHRVKLINLDLK